MTGSGREAKSVAEQFAQNLVRCRVSAGLSQEQLGARAGLNRTHVSLLEQAKRLPRLDTAVRLAGGLGVDPEELLWGMSWQPSERTEGGFRDDEPAPG